MEIKGEIGINGATGIKRPCSLIFDLISEYISSAGIRGYSLDMLDYHNFIPYIFRSGEQWFSLSHRHLICPLGIYVIR